MVTISASSACIRQWTSCCCCLLARADDHKTEISVSKLGQVNLWPNPTAAQLNLELPLDVPTDISIFDAACRLVHREQTPVAGMHSVPVASWTPGVYAVRLSNVHGQVSKQFVVARP